MTGLPTHDPSVIACLRSEIGDDATVEQIIRDWHDEIGGLVAGLRKALGDQAELGRRAHRIKGSSLTLGLPCLAELCRAIEGRCRLGQGPCDDLVAAVEAELPRCLAALPRP